MSLSDATQQHHPRQERLSLKELGHIFEQLDPQEVEQFYQGYHLWLQQQRRELLESQIASLRQQQRENAVQLQRLQPPPIALAALAQLQAYGVEDIDLLDRMLERGEEWLDHTMQLLVRCQELGVIHGNYTEWCEHALEGAYEWIASIMNEANGTSTLAPSLPSQQAAEPDIDFAPAVTEEMMLQMLMSDVEYVPPTLDDQEATATTPATETSTAVMRTPSIEHEETDALPSASGIEVPDPALLIDTSEDQDVRQDSTLTLVGDDELANAPLETIPEHALAMVPDTAPVPVSEPESFATQDEEAEDAAIEMQDPNLLTVTEEMLLQVLMGDTDHVPAIRPSTLTEQPATGGEHQDALLPEATEEMLLQVLMSDTDAASATASALPIAADATPTLAEDETLLATDTTSVQAEDETPVTADTPPLHPENETLLATDTLPAASDPTEPTTPLSSEDTPPIAAVEADPESPLIDTEQTPPSDTDDMHPESLITTDEPASRSTNETPAPDEAALPLDINDTSPAADPIAEEPATNAISTQDEASTEIPEIATDTIASEPATIEQPAPEQAVNDQSSPDEAAGVVQQEPSEIEATTAHIEVPDVAPTEDPSTVPATPITEEALPTAETSEANEPEDMVPATDHASDTAGLTATAEELTAGPTPLSIPETETGELTIPAAAEDESKQASEETSATDPVVEEGRTEAGENQETETGETVTTPATEQTPPESIQKVEEQAESAIQETEDTDEELREDTLERAAIPTTTPQTDEALSNDNEQTAEPEEQQEQDPNRETRQPGFLKRSITKIWHL